MKKNFILLFINCCLIFSGYAQQAPTSLLWQISGPGITAPSYLFGTFHIMCKSDFTFSDTLKSKLVKAKSFYGELDMNDPGMQAQLVMKSLMTGSTLQSLFGKEDYPRLSDAFQQITGMSMQMVDRFKPFMTMSLLSMSTMDCKERWQPETEFLKLAKANGLGVGGLESIEAQVAVMDAEPLDSQVVALKRSILNFDSVKAMMNQMIAMYKLRDPERLYQFMKQTGISDHMEQIMLTDRNKRWIPLIGKAIQKEPVFFAVGAGHLGGPQGVLALLRKEGYQVIPIVY